MDQKAGQIVARWTMLLAIAFGVLIMHHVQTSHGHAETGHGIHDTTAVTSSVAMHDGAGEERDAPHGGTDLWHLCLAVLGMAVGLALFRVLLVVSRSAPSPQWIWHRSPSNRQRPPPRRGREVLHQVCVLRV